MWGRFFGEQLFDRAQDRTADGRNFGVYSAYAPDPDGAFDVTAGVAVSTAEATVTVDAADHLVWNGNGEMPQTVVSLWQQIWTYFKAHPQIRRPHVSDFEAYTSPTEVRVCIGVE